MSRIKGNFSISNNYEVRKAAPFDARMLVKLKSDLTDPLSWSVIGVYNGMLVSVGEDTAENNGLYILINDNDISNEKSWIKIANETQIEELNKRIDSIVVGAGGAIQVNTRSELPSIGEKNGIYFVVNEDATYRWDETTLTYICVGRDYKEIKIINGGDANQEI